MGRMVTMLCLAMLAGGCNGGDDREVDPIAPEKPSGTLRVATFNISFYRDSRGQMAADLRAGADQAQAVAEIIQRVDPDILVLNEIDYSTDREVLSVFRERYLGRSWHGSTPIFFTDAYQGPVNTGVPSGFDLNRDGEVNAAGGQDAWGYGVYPGQYGMAVLSKFPIDRDAIRTFQTFKWRDMPGAKLPSAPETDATGDWYSDEILARFPLSSKSHWDVPIRLSADRTLHLLASHPTPPGFDGDEDRNGRRNHDEIRLWADYVTPGAGDYLYDDQGRRGGLDPGTRFVIAGDLNADPHDGGAAAAIAQLLNAPGVNSALVPSSQGGVAAAERQGGPNLDHRGDPAHDTGDFNDDPDDGVGNLRVDYVLPSAAGWEAVDGGVYWPVPDHPRFSLVGDYPYASSDHRLVWMDLRLEGD